MKKLVGKKEIEDALKRLDKLTQDEARMAAAENLKLTHVVDNKVTDLQASLNDKATSLQASLVNGTSGMFGTSEHKREHRYVVQLETIRKSRNKLFYNWQTASTMSNVRHRSGCSRLHRP